MPVQGESELTVVLFNHPLKGGSGELKDETLQVPHEVDGVGGVRSEVCCELIIVELRGSQEDVKLDLLLRHVWVDELGLTDFDCMVLEVSLQAAEGHLRCVHDLVRVLGDDLAEDSVLTSRACKLIEDLNLVLDGDT